MHACTRLFTCLYAFFPSFRVVSYLPEGFRHITPSLSEFIHYNFNIPQVPGSLTHHIYLSIHLPNHTHLFSRCADKLFRWLMSLWWVAFSFWYRTVSCLAQHMFHFGTSQFSFWHNIVFILVQNIIILAQHMFHYGTSQFKFYHNTVFILVQNII